MTAKEYLSQAYSIDHLIKAKLQQAQSFYSLATYMSPTVSDMPGSGSQNIHQMGDAVAGLIDIKNEIDAELKRLIELRQEIMKAISQVDDFTCQTLLELRYLCFKGWDEIAEQMGYESKYIFKLHNTALKKVETKRDYRGVD